MIKFYFKFLDNEKTRNYYFYGPLFNVNYSFKVSRNHLIIKNVLNLTYNCS